MNLKLKVKIQGGSLKLHRKTQKLKKTPYH